MLKYIYLIYIRKYLIVGSKFNHQVALIRKYIYMGIYMEVFSLQPRAQTFISAYIIVGLS